MAAPQEQATTDSTTEVRQTALRVVSYNLREHTANSELAALAESSQADVLCVQECDSTDLATSVGGLTLAASTQANRLGLAIYKRDDRFDVRDLGIHSLQKSLHDRVLSPAHERLIAMHLYDREADTEVIVASFHASPLTATNSLRRKQIEAAHDFVRDLSSEAPAIMVGDFNYPWFQTNLRRKIEESGFALSLSDQPTYLRYRKFTGHFDFATSVGLHIAGVETLPAGISDHRPILVRADYEEPAAVEAPAAEDAPAA
ncbi:endonuclease/exonuclease/phosphatase family protein [Curtobacterium sp. MCJR17_055]|uniref:endonuclease/exonuclease/phosphatase family protein n=1 Tax=unclassified Curtobacterium TaxID=257496 RepID=UPI000D8A7A3F|nr:MULTISPECIES: endonuclease/exonuclease/phosphatase family protein [unclassified Curtobacterium]PYY36153.1 endonuclease/exonuclease/phosphatase family protein [Curtobacterium sp. MCBD17_029]PYY54745.1 endonuclease/exonuclease/phosphatase family protein [Curtobacterium sp. MCJR17_055]PYY60980.1 endonuclease/exonuclease/phosphatase family protein [Curtobacterium sp. MCPF17_015]PZE95962.1 endonuclease/exonuclease/phosphatase family protein [Curtobacterium sp. MCBD17_008]WIB14718.1 endonuclease/